MVFSSFSKYFSMTGWRIGWMLVPERLRRAVDVLTGNFTICPPVLAQRACLAAFDDASYAELDGHVARYAENRRLLLDGLPRLGITRLAPADGAFYVYADVGHLTDDSMAFAHDLLARTGVALAPGIDFDTVEGGRFVRLSFAGPGAEIEQALERLSVHLEPVDARRSARAGSGTELRGPAGPHHHRGGARATSDRVTYGADSAAEAADRAGAPRTRAGRRPLIATSRCRISGRRSTTARRRSRRRPGRAWYGARRREQRAAVGGEGRRVDHGGVVRHGAGDADLRTRRRSSRGRRCAESRTYCSRGVSRQDRQPLDRW